MPAGSHHRQTTVRRVAVDGRRPGCEPGRTGVGRRIIDHLPNFYASGVATWLGKPGPVVSRAECTIGK